MFRHLQRYMLAVVHGLALDRRTSCLDYGCGSGYGTEMLALYFPRTIGVDISLEAIDYARVMHTRSGAQFVTRLEDADPPEKFDYITCIEMIEHLDKVDAAKLLKRFAGLLAPGGRLVLTTPISIDLTPTNPHHAHEYIQEEFKLLLETYFHGVEVIDISMGMPNMIAICWEPR